MNIPLMKRGLVLIFTLLAIILVSGCTPAGEIEISFGEIDLGGTYPVTITITLDLSGHDPFIGMPSSMDLEVFQSDITVTGPSPWVEVTGALQSDGSFSATGRGTVAGFPNIVVTFEGTLTSAGLSGEYTMGAEGGLPTRQPITYHIQGQRAS